MSYLSVSGLACRGFDGVTFETAVLTAVLTSESAEFTASRDAWRPVEAVALFEPTFPGTARNEVRTFCCWLLLLVDVSEDARGIWKSISIGRPNSRPPTETVPPSWPVTAKRPLPSATARLSLGKLTLKMFVEEPPVPSPNVIGALRPANAVSPFVQPPVPLADPKQSPALPPRVPLLPAPNLSDPRLAVVVLSP